MKQETKGCVIWFTGLSGSGKSTLANKLKNDLNRIETHSIILDGDEMRNGLCNDLRFSIQDREENIRRISEVAKVIANSGLICITSLISPLKISRDNARKIIGDDKFILIHLSTSLEACEKRDVKGLYAKARNGEIQNFTGISSPYDIPDNATLTIDTEKFSVYDSSFMIMQFLMDRGLVKLY